MKRNATQLLLVFGFLLGACTDGTSLPEATGKASITAINAIPGSPSISFLIEERSLGTISYKGTSASASYDDLDYTFNFETFYAGDADFRRIASQHIDFEKGMHYTLLASGNLNSPDITVWETPEREFDGTETVFQARFAHASAQLGAIDVYFALDGVAPVLGEQVATLTLGQITEPIDFESDDYVITITTSGDDTDILHQSYPSTLLPGTELIIAPFDADENDNSPIAVRGLTSLGGTISFHDPQYPATVQFMHAAKEMGNTNVYDDELLTSQIIANHDHKDLTTAVPIAAGDYEYFYEPVANPMMTTLSTSFSPARSGNYRVTAVGSGGDYSTVNLSVDRRSVLTSARLAVFNSTNNYEFNDVYLVDPGDTIDGKLPFRSGLTPRSPVTPVDVLPGSYDLYVTDFLGTEPVAGPFPLTVDFGDVVDLVIFDTDDTAVLEIVDVSGL